MMRNFLPVQAPLLQKEPSGSTYKYREYRPCRGLEPYVACYWTVGFSGSDDAKLHRILPDGCVDIIFDLRSPSLSQGAFVAGLMTTYSAVALTGTHSLFGVRFYSDTVRYFIKYPAAEVTGNRALLEDLWGNEAALLTESLLSANGTAEIIGKVESSLLAKLLRNEKDHTGGLLQTSMNYMYASRGIITIRSLAERIGCSERTLRRTFQQELGVSPKELLGILRFQNLLGELYRAAPARLTDLAANYGYYDQPHFINQFKRYYGLLPHQVLNQAHG